MRKTRIALAALMALTIAPSLAASPAAHAGRFNGIALTEFERATPASTIVYQTIQSTTASQPVNLNRLGAIFGPAVQRAINGAAGSSSNSTSTTQAFTQLIARFKTIFNGEYGLALLPVTTGPHGTNPKVHLLVEAGLQPGITTQALLGSFALLGLAGTPKGTYHGLAIASIDLASLANLAGGGAGGAGAGGAGLPKNSPVSSVVYLTAAGNDAVVATDLPSLKSAINTYTGAAPSIADSPSFAKTVGVLPTGRFATLYVHIDTKQLQPALAALGSSPSSAGASQAKGTLSVAGSLSAEKDGLLATISPQYGTGSFAQAIVQTPTPNAGLGFFPGNALLYASINDPGSLIHTALVTASQSGAFASLGVPAGADPTPMIEKMTGLNLNSDVISWMHGELSFALLPVGAASYGKDNALAKVSFVMALKVQNQALVAAKLAKIIAALNKQSSKSSQEHFVQVPGPGGVLLRIATSTPNGVGYAFYKGYLILASALPADVATLQKVSPGTSVGVSPRYQAALAHFGGRPFGSVLYVDITGVRQLAEKVAAASGTDMSQYNTLAKPLLTAFKSLAAVNYAGPHGGAALFVAISK